MVHCCVFEVAVDSTLQGCMRLWGTCIACDFVICGHCHPSFQSPQISRESWQHDWVASGVSLALQISRLHHATNCIRAHKEHCTSSLASLCYTDWYLQEMYWLGQHTEHSLPVALANPAQLTRRLHYHISRTQPCQFLHLIPSPY